MATLLAALAGVYALKQLYPVYFLSVVDKHYGEQELRSIARQVEKNRTDPSRTVTNPFALGQRNLSDGWSFNHIRHLEVQPRQPHVPIPRRPNEPTESGPLVSQLSWANELAYTPHERQRRQQCQVSSMQQGKFDPFIPASNWSVQPVVRPSMDGLWQIQGQ